MLKSLLTIVTALGFCNAQYFPPEPEGLTELKSKFNNDVKISYKAVSTCLLDFAPKNVQESLDRTDVSFRTAFAIRV